jgi:hypothetical protein
LSLKSVVDFFSSSDFFFSSDFSFFTIDFSFSNSFLFSLYSIQLVQRYSIKIENSLFSFILF